MREGDMQIASHIGNFWKEICYNNLPSVVNIW